MNSYRSRCEDCICLVEGDNGEWVCDELQKKVEEVKDCPQGLELNQVASTPLKGGIRLARCKSGGAEIKWIRTAKNKRRMPVDVPAITVITTLGHVIKAYTPHGANCPGAKHSCNPVSSTLY